MSLRSTSREVWVGLVLVVALTGLIGLFALAGSGPGFLSSSHTFDVIFRDGQGIRAGSPVRIAGIDAGRVVDVDLIEIEGSLRARVRVALPVPLAERLKQDAKVTIRINGMVIAPVPPDAAIGTPFQDVPLPGGMNRVLVTRDMVSVPGEHTFEIRAAFQEVDAKDLEATFTAVQSAREELRAIAESLSSLLGGQAPDLRPLANVLDGAAAELEGHLRSRGSALIASTASTGAPAAGGGATGNSATGAAAAATTIQNSADVVLWIDRMCEFYAKHEPSSPVPLLLQRAKRLVSKSFLDVLRDLVPDGLNQAMLFHGPKEES